MKGVLPPPSLHQLPAHLAAPLERGAVVLTASARAARALRRSYAEDARAAGRTSWPLPAIEDWAAWLDRLYRQLTLTSSSPLPLLLTPLQEELLWTRVQAAEAHRVVSPDRLARLAQSGYALLSAYEAHAERRAPWAAAHEDAERFLDWSATFDKQCEALQALPRGELENLLHRHAAALGPLPELYLVGFDRLTPAQTRLLEAVKRAGTYWQLAPASPPALKQILIIAAEEQEELKACATWVRAQLEENPRQRIAVLVPELGSIQAEMDRVFRRTLLPESARIATGGANTGAVPYEFSLGMPLGQVPLVHAALLLLRWLAGALPAAEITSLLLGGFLADSTVEARQLAAADVTLRRRALLATEMSLGALLRQAQRLPGLLPAGFVERLRAADAWARPATRLRSHAEWAEQAAAQLELLGWPGAGELSSTAYQAKTRWDALLSQVASLSFAGDRIRLGAFAQALQGFAVNTLFAAESRSAPVQILGAAEASGQSFDAVWFLRVTEGRWPSGGRLHPLLAPGVQRDAAMPHTTPEGDRELAAEQLRRIVASAPLVVCSSVRQLDGADARPSPLLRGFAGGIESQALVAAAPLAHCEVVQHCEPEAVAPWPFERAAGGSDVLKRQAACGFQSFARRLGASAVGDEAWGLDAGKRASLLHAALEQLWSTEAVEAGADRLHTRDDLRHAFAAGTLDAMLAAAVARSFQSLVREAEGEVDANPWRRRYLELEQQRLCTRLRAWLGLEQQRADFRVIELEKNLPAVAVGGLRLNLRADRVDEVAENKRLIVDYKTADRVNTGLWMGPRPDEPQLPLYATFGGIDAVEGILFAQLRASKTQAHAMAVDPKTQIGGIVPADKSVLDGDVWTGWQAALRALADQYLRGEAPVNPKRGAQTCVLCRLEGICRVREQPGMRAVLAEDAAENSLVDSVEPADA